MLPLSLTLSACKKIASFFVGVGKHFLMKSENVYPPLMNSVISRMESYSFAIPQYPDVLSLEFIPFPQVLSHDGRFHWL